MSKSNQKNIRLAWAVLCSGVSIDKETNNVSLYNIIEEINIPRNKLIKVETSSGKSEFAIPLSFRLFSVWPRIGKPGLILGDIKVDVIDPSKKIRKAADYSFRIAEKNVGLRLTIPWKGIKVNSSGVYTFRMLKKLHGEKNLSKAGEIYLKVNILEDKQPSKSKRSRK